MLFPKTREALTVLKKAKLIFWRYRHIFKKDNLSLSEMSLVYEKSKKTASALLKVSGNNFFLDAVIWRAWKYFDRLQDKTFWRMVQNFN